MGADKKKKEYTDWTTAVAAEATAKKGKDDAVTAWTTISNKINERLKIANIKTAKTEWEAAVAAEKTAITKCGDTCKTVANNKPVAIKFKDAELKTFKDKRVTEDGKVTK